jgi:hypothetical protein
MLSRIKDMRGVTGFALGAAVVALLVPTAAVAATLTYTGLKDAHGDKALIGSNGQLYTTNAPPNTLFNDGPVTAISTSYAQVVNTPTGYAAIITEISLDESGGSPTTAQLYLGPNGCASVSTLLREVIVNGTSHTEMTFPTGLVIPNGDALCAIHSAGLADFLAAASGYAVPSGEVG